MKIPHSISSRYQALEDRYLALAAIVKRIFEDDIKTDRWLFLSRLKTLESFYIKAQSGRWEALYEDIFATTIVVENVGQVKEAVASVLNFFELDHKRPKDDRLTQKRPESFVFDDLRLYLKLKERDTTPETENLIFECQIKTFLQHAWSIATHDLIYKPKDVGEWSRARVAYQVKAMLEHAEVAISQVEEIAKSEALGVSSPEYNQRAVILRDLKDLDVDVGELPDRVIENVRALVMKWGCDWKEVYEWLKKETLKGDGYGVKQARFSIYEEVVDAIVRNDRLAICKYRELLRQNKASKILVSDELLESHQGLCEIGRKCS